MINPPIITFIVAALTLSALHGQQTQPPAWSPEQATGAPDTHEAGDLPTAWASLDPDGGPEWLEVEFEKPTDVAEVRIRETFNPGAVNRVVALSDSNEEFIIWEGQAQQSVAPAEMVVKPNAPVTSNRIRVHLDTARVPGWNEIDAVEIVGKDGKRQWAKNATASSTYASKRPVAQAAEARGAGAKYSELLKTIEVKADEAQFGDYYDFGYRAKDSWAGHENLPPGYWVYIAPNWFIFAKSDASEAGHENSSTDELTSELRALREEVRAALQTRQ